MPEKCRNFCDFFSVFGHVQDGKLLKMALKSIFMHLYIKIMIILTSQMIFDIFKLSKPYELNKIEKFWIKQSPFIQNFAKQPYIYIVPIVLRIIFYP